MNIYTIKVYNMMLKTNCLALSIFIALIICESNGVIQNKEEQTFTGNLLSDRQTWKLLSISFFSVHIMYYKLNAASEEAKELLTQKICETFLCHNWGPHNSNNEADSEITVYGDRLFSVPQSILPDFLPWIMQYRISRLNSPAEIDLDIAIHPNTNMGKY